MRACISVCMCVCVAEFGFSTPLAMTPSYLLPRSASSSAHRLRAKWNTEGIRTSVREHTTAERRSRIRRAIVSTMWIDTVWTSRARHPRSVALFFSFFLSLSRASLRAWGHAIFRGEFPTTGSHRQRGDRSGDQRGATSKLLRKNTGKYRNVQSQHSPSATIN